MTTAPGAAGDAGPAGPAAPAYPAANRMLLRMFPMTANADFNGNANGNGSGSLPVAAARPVPEVPAVPAVSSPPVAPGAAVYVDTENLQDNARAHDVVRQVIAGWPPEHPPLGSLSLYVRADKVELWQLWAAAEYPALRLRVRGVQHFSNHRAKNSADLAIAADAVADLITGRAAMVAVVSNDSDFGALFVKVRELAETAAGPGSSPGFGPGAPAPPPPFLWITAPDAGLLSPEIERFIPSRHRWDLSETSRSAPPEPLPPAVPPSPAVPPAAPAATPAPAPPPAAPAATPASPVSAPTPAVVRTAPTPPVSAPTPAPAPATASGATANANANAGASTAANPGSAAVAEELIRRLPAGRFKVGDAQKVIRKRWPKLADVGDTAKLGQYLLKEVWPELQQRGVTMPVTKSPRAYEITQAAKDAIAGPPAVQSKTTPAAAPSPPAAVLPQPSPELLAAAVAADIAEDTFSASQAQAIIKTRFPGLPAADTTPQRFGTWFVENLWPVIQRHGVNIAREKPRRYEMTPDARHRLAELVREN